MDLSSVKFGDVFKFKEKDYIFLAKSDQIIFAAEILDGGSTKQIKDLYERSCRNGRIEKVKSNILYCFVELSTEEFKGRMAHFVKSEKDENNFFIGESYLSLDKKDILELKKEIEQENSAVPILLKELVAKLDIQ
jgi:hypothetical protein